MKRKSLFLFLLFALGATGAMAQQQCAPITISTFSTWTENFTLADWEYYNTQNGNYNLFSEYPEKCWLVPYTISADNGTTSPRLWYNGTNSNRHISMKEGSSSTKRDQIVAFPVFNKPLSTLTIQFTSKLNKNGSRNLKIGYYNTNTNTFTELQNVSVSGTSDQTCGPYNLGSIANTPTTYNANYRLAFMLPANADGFSCDVKNIVITYMPTYPTEISSVDDWNAFCQAVNGGHDYSGETVTLMNHLPTAVTNMAGTESNPFSGTFEGQGHTITFGANTSDDYCAPFRYAKTATFQNLKIDGTINTSNKFAAGFVGQVKGGDGCTFYNCESNINIISSVSGDGTHGGFVANILNGTNTFTGCAFTGSITTTVGTTNCGGFAGWCETDNGAKIFLTDCLFAPSNTSNISSGSKTFFRIRSKDETYWGLTNCYYTQSFGEAQGKKAYSITGVSPVTVAMSGTETEYNTSLITAYNDNQGLLHNGTIFAAGGDNVNLVLGGALNFEANHGDIEANGDHYTLIMDAYDTEISGNSNCPMPTNVVATNVTPTSATLNWNGITESYNVRYREAAYDEMVFFDGFESGNLNGWTVYTYGQSLHDLGMSYEGWFVESSEVTHSGNYSAIACSYYQDGNNNNWSFNANNWLITPQVPLGGTLSFWVWSNWGDEFEVRLSTTGTATSDFTTTLRALDAANVYNEWEEITIDLNGYTGQGYIAIHHVQYDGYWLIIDDFSIRTPQEASQWIPTENGESTGGNSLKITGLTPETEYEFQVQAVRGEDDESSWSTIASFTTLSSCAVPTGLTAEVIGNAAELSWTDYTETYNMQYRDFNPTALATVILNVPGDYWSDHSGYQMLLDADATAYGTIFPESGALTQSGDASVETYAEFEYKIPTNADGSTNTSNIVINGSASIEIPAGTYDWCITNPSPGVRIWIAAEHGNVGGRQNDYVFEAGKTYEFTVYQFSNGDDAVDVTITDNGSDWTTIDNVTNPYMLQNLSTQTTYQYKVQGVDCDGEGGTTDWSEVAVFTTHESYSYIKPITAWTTEPVGGWYLIASPVASVTPTANNGFLTNTYDLYYFDQTGGANGKEWKNYKQNPFNLVSGTGYLYANSDDVNLVFTGEPYSGNGQVTLHKTESAPQGEWNLIGNPFTTSATIGDKPFYRMNDGGTEIIAATVNTVAAMEGVFVYANSDSETVNFSTGAKRSNEGEAGLVVNLSKGGAIIDRAIVRFGEGQSLPKFQIRDNSTKLYIPQDGKDYANACAEGQGEMPLNFKANENGTYTLSINPEGVEMAYLHLIDNMTGADVDLLAATSTGSVASYTFNAKTTDYESRFRLVFVANSEDGSSTGSEAFAFISNGNIIVNGEGTLQVVDVMGRVIRTVGLSQCGSRTTTAGMPAGLYVLRLINGENVRTQKIVIE